MNSNTLQLIIVLLIVGSSVISWIIRTLQEQRAKKRVRDERDRRELEVLRTGRSASESGPSPTPVAVEPVPTPSDPEEARRAELARRRREQIDMLRKRQAARTGQATAGPATGPATGTSSAPATPDLVIQLPGGRTLRIPSQTPQPGTPSTASPRSAAPGGPTVRKAAKPRERSAAMLPPQPITVSPTASAPGALAAGLASEQGVSSTRAQLEPRGVPAPEAARLPITGLNGRPMTTADWRQAFILGQVLGRPLAERRPGDEPLAPM